MSRAPALGYIYSLKHFAATQRAARLNDVVTMNYVSNVKPNRRKKKHPHQLAVYIVIAPDKVAVFLR